jgi:hypothetical protein
MLFPKTEVSQHIFNVHLYMIYFNISLSYDLLLGFSYDSFPRDFRIINSYSTHTSWL